MRNAYLTNNHGKWIFCMALATASIAGLPQKAMAVPSIDIVQQTNIVKGQVIDGNGDPIIGATVQVKGSKTGSVTDLDGNFSLNARPGETIIVSYIGFKTKETKAGNGPLNIKLEEDNKTLNEVVVVGYGTMRKKDLTGSVVQIDPKKSQTRTRTTYRTSYVVLPVCRLALTPLPKVAAPFNFVARTLSTQRHPTTLH